MKQQRNMSMRRWISNLLFLVAAVLFIYVGYTYYQERNNPIGQIPTPQSIPGKAELKNVHDAIVAQGASVDYGRQSVRIDGVIPVGQQLTVDGASIYVFLFEDPDARMQESTLLDPDTLQLKTPSGADAATGHLTITEGSNVLVVSDNVPDTIQQKIDAGIQSLP